MYDIKDKLFSRIKIWGRVTIQEVLEQDRWKEVWAPMPEDTTRLRRSLTIKTASKVNGQECKILQMISLVDIWQLWEDNNQDLLDPINYWLLWNDLEFFYLLERLLAERTLIKEDIANWMDVQKEHDQTEEVETAVALTERSQSSGADTPSGLRLRSTASTIQRPVLKSTGETPWLSVLYTETPRLPKAKTPRDPQQHADADESTQDDPKQMHATPDSPVQLLEETLLDIHAAIKFVVLSVISHAFAHSQSILVSKQGAPVQQAAAGEGVGLFVDEVDEQFLRVDTF